MTKLLIGCDHRGFKLKQYLIGNLKDRFDIDDVGCYSGDSVDYPNISSNLAHAMENQVDPTFGIIICGSGIGVSIAVNRYSFIRGALVFNKEVASSSRKHNNSNVICLASDYISEYEALEYVSIFLEEKFDGGRHQKRVEQLNHMC